jgi:hypothetical protein
MIPIDIKTQHSELYIEYSIIIFIPTLIDFETPILFCRI